MKFLCLLGVFFGGELLALPIFWALKKLNQLPPESPAVKGSTLRGVIERFTLLIGLVYGFPQILIAFGALKIGTRLSEETNCLISNAYFLTGNLLSILLAMAYAIIVKDIWWNKF